MSTPFQKPHFEAGTPLNSGDVQTGEIAFTRGGGRSACVFSGAIAMGVAACNSGALSSGGSVRLTTGAGRLNSFTALWPAGAALAANGEGGCVSGQPIVVYDSAITARSGVYTDSTIAESGRKILYTWAPAKGIASGLNLLLNGQYDPRPLDIPFQSGLCVMALSGAPGFSISWTPETLPIITG